MAHEHFTLSYPGSDHSTEEAIGAGDGVITTDDGGGGGKSEKAIGAGDGVITTGDGGAGGKSEKAIGAGDGVITILLQSVTKGRYDRSAA